MAAKFTHYRSILNSLKKHCPAAYPVTVRRVNLTLHEGRCWKHGKRFFIQIDSKLDEYGAINVLLHEWAHARGWSHRLDTAVDDETFNKLAHDAVWGVAYAEVYSLYEKIIVTAAL